MPPPSARSRTKRPSSAFRVRIRQGDDLDLSNALIISALVLGFVVTRSGWFLFLIFCVI